MPINTKATKKAGSRRDNFSAAVVQILFKRAGGKCCRCDATTFGPVANNPSKSVNIGQAAHIAAAAPGGPRYDPSMIPEERASVTNGMWMCSNCHDIIDRDVDEYPIAKLRLMRKKAEQRAKVEMGVGISKGVSEITDGVAVGVSAATIVDIRKAKAEIRALNGGKLSESRAEELLELVSFIDPTVDSYLPAVGIELIAFYEQLVVHCKQAYVVLEVVRRLGLLADAYHTQWTQSDVEAVTRVSERVLKSSASKRSRTYQSAAALLKDLSSYKVLREKGLDKIAVQSLKGGTDLTDGDTSPPGAKRACLDGETSPPGTNRACLDGEVAGGPPPMVCEEERYMELMEQLSVCQDPTEAEKLEEKLITMGFEPDIV